MTFETWQAIAVTPWWIYVFLFMLLNLSYRSSKPRYLLVKGEMLLQIVIISLFLLGVFSIIDITRHTTSLFTLGLVCGVIFGWLHLKSLRIAAIKGKKIIYIPGSYHTFIFLALIIVGKYAFFGANYLDYQAYLAPKYHNHLVTLSGLMAGLFIGRFYVILRCLRMGPFRGELPNELQNPRSNTQKIMLKMLS